MVLVYLQYGVCRRQGYDAWLILKSSLSLPLLFASDGSADPDSTGTISCRRLIITLAAL